MSKYRVTRRKRRQSSSIIRDLLLITIVAAVGAAFFVTDIQQVVTDIQQIMLRNGNPVQNDTIKPMSPRNAQIRDANPYSANDDPHRTTEAVAPEPPPVPPNLNEQPPNQMAEAAAPEPSPIPPNPNEQPPSASAEPPASLPSAHEPATTGTLEAQSPDATPNTTCLPDGLRTVLDEVRARFGPVTIVSTTTLNTDNHFRGGVRERLHFACKAVDFRVDARTEDVVRFLRTRPEVAGLNTYRSGVIHIDANEKFSAATQQSDLR